LPRAERRVWLSHATRAIAKHWSTENRSRITGREDAGSERPIVESHIRLS
jgi:hypothetical protein